MNHYWYDIILADSKSVEFSSKEKKKNEKGLTFKDHHNYF